MMHSCSHSDTQMACAILAVVELFLGCFYGYDVPVKRARHIAKQYCTLHVMSVDGMMTTERRGDKVPLNSKAKPASLVSSLNKYIHAQDRCRQSAS